jgi:hypothetical protein
VGSEMCIRDSVGSEMCIRYRSSEHIPKSSSALLHFVK